VLAAKRKSIAIAFLKNADRARYGGLWGDLENQFTRGLDHYPGDVVGAYNLLTNYKPPPRQYQQRQQVQHDDSDTASGVSALTFLQGTGPVPGTNGVTHATVECFHCHDKGHYADLCPARDGTTMLQFDLTVPSEGWEEPWPGEFTFLNVAIEHNQSDFQFPPAPRSSDSWILLDSQSTVSVFKNRRLLSDIRGAKHKLRVYTNGGIQINSEIGTVRNFGDVWFNPASLANILSMSAVSKVCRITMDTSVENALHVHRANGTIMTFKEFKSGLYYYDAAAVQDNHSSQQVDAYLFLNTVASKKAQYTRREIEGAENARKLHRLIGDPSEKDYDDILQNNRVRNCPLTADDAKRALNIWGPAVHALEGKMVKKQNKGIPNYHPVLIPAPIIAKYKRIRLFMDIFWVNGSPYFHTISEFIKFRTVAPIANRLKNTLWEQGRSLNVHEDRNIQVYRRMPDHAYAHARASTLLLLLFCYRCC
jgi:hypothetical protein